VFKKKLIFYSTIEGIEKTMPIISSKEYKHQWIQKAKTNYKESNNGNHRSVVNCPGIFKIKNEGWLIRTWQDIELYINENLYEWKTPLNQKELSSHFKIDQINHHDEHMLYDNFENWPKNTFSKIIKINTPWTVDVPKGYILHQIHPAYLDENRFTALPGSYTSDLGLSTLNVPVFWHSKNGRFLIKAGTPIAQLILTKKENIVHTNVVGNNDKKFLFKEKLTNLLLHSSFKRMYKKINNFWKNYD